MLDHDDLLSGASIEGSGFSTTHLEYAGPATTLKIKPKNLKKCEVKINGYDFAIPNNEATIFSGPDLTVHLYNDNYKPKSKGKNNTTPMGHWWIEVSADRGSIMVDGDF